MAYKSKVALIAITLTLPLVAQIQPQHDSGQSVTGAFEGWYKNPDGTFSILLGYFNRNIKEELDIPIGPDNRSCPTAPRACSATPTISTSTG